MPFGYWRYYRYICPYRGAQVWCLTDHSSGTGTSRPLRVAPRSDYRAASHNWSIGVRVGFRVFGVYWKHDWVKTPVGQGSNP